MNEWYTGNFDKINWNAMHWILISNKEIRAWKELYSEKFRGESDYNIKYMHVFESANNMQKSMHLINKSYIFSGKDAFDEISKGLYNGLINGDTEHYSRITLELFKQQHDIKKVFFDLVFYNE